MNLTSQAFKPNDTEDYKSDFPNAYSTQQSFNNNFSNKL